MPSRIYKEVDNNEFAEVFLEYESPGIKDIKLEITDSDGRTCSKEKTIEVRFELPDWKEVKPFQ